MLALYIKIDLEALSKILLRQSDKLNMFYTKHFYGFEKEGKCDYYQEKATKGHYFNFKYPLKKDAIEGVLMRCLNLPIDSVEFLLPRPYKERVQEAREKKALEQRLAMMTPRERRQYDRAMREKESIEEDKKAEKLMREAIDVEKRRLGKVEKTAAVNVCYERLRGLIRLEEGSGDTTVDYEIIVRQGEFTIRSLQNQSRRLTPEELGFMVYGKNIVEGEGTLREILKVCRTPLLEKLPLRDEDDITDEEIAQLQERFVVDHLPAGWRYDGKIYYHVDEKYSGTHPGLYKLIEIFVEEENVRIGEHNRLAQKRFEEDAKMYN